MNRIHAPEIEDYEWCPALWRDTLTDVLRASSEWLHLFDSAAFIVHEMLNEQNDLNATAPKRIVDLCSGGGGPAVALASALERQHDARIDVVLTDKYPNVTAFDRIEAEHRGRITAIRESIDATALPDELVGLRTLFNALHHFRPPMARAIFASAARARQPIASFEMVERSIQGAFIVGGAPFFAAAVMPFLSPRSWQRLALTYALPLLPAMITWDGFASCLRAYSPDELRALVEGLGDEHYHFRVVTRRTSWHPIRVTALIGTPV